MKFQAQRKDLIPMLARCQAIADQKSTMPILANVLIEVLDGELTLSATNLGIDVTGSIREIVDAEDGSYAVGARDLLERVKAMPDGPIVFSVGDALNIKSGTRRFAMPYIPGDEFPAIATLGNVPETALDSAEFLDAIGTVSNSVSDDETRLHLNSALLEVDGGTLLMVATDGHRLNKTEREIANGANIKALIPKKALTEIRRLCDSASGDIALSNHQGRLFASVDRVTISTKLPDAVFPPWQMVIPKGHSGTATMDRNALMDSVRALGVSASRTTEGIVLTFERERLEISSADPASGDGFDSVPCDYTGNTLRLGVSGKYLREALEVMRDETVVIGVGEELDPIVINPGAKTLAVVMPMRI